MSPFRSPHCSLLGLLPERGDVVVVVLVVAGSAEARGQKETHRYKKRGARYAAKVPGVIDVMTVYPSCCVATA